MSRGQIVVIDRNSIARLHSHVLVHMYSLIASRCHNRASYMSSLTASSRHIKVHLTPKYFFAQINLCTCLKRIAPFSPFNPNLDFVQAVKVTKSGHHLLRDRASKGYGSIPGWTSQTDLHACLQRLKAGVQVKAVFTSLNTAFLPISRSRFKRR